MDSAYDRPDFGVSAAFVYCLWMNWSGFFKLSNESLSRIYESELYDFHVSSALFSDIPDGHMLTSHSRYLS